MSTHVVPPTRAESFEAAGFIGPVRILPLEDCPSMLRRLNASPPPLVWKKGHAIVSRAFYELGTHPAILEIVRELLGEDVLLWGAKLVVRGPGKEHGWHTDIEGTVTPGRTIAAWVGLENTNARSSLRVVSGSHRFESLQQVTTGGGQEGRKAVTRTIARWARERDPSSRLENVETHDGEAIFFDGRLWHGSVNTNWSGVRSAALFQYATPDAPMRVPDSKDDYSGSARFLESLRPACILVSGRDRFHVNEVVPPPADAPDPADAGSSPDPLWPSWVGSLRLPPLGRHRSPGFVACPLFEGTMHAMQDLSVELGVLGPAKTGGVARPTHDEEELTVLLSGRLELEASAEGRTAASEAASVGPGDVFYQPPSGRLAIRNPGPQDARFLSLRWRNEAASGPAETLQTKVFRSAPVCAASGSSPVEIANTSTAGLRRLRCRRVELAPGAVAFAADGPGDRALLVLEGQVELVGSGRTLGAMGFVYSASAGPVVPRCAGELPARCLVFEFEGGSYEPRRAVQKGDPGREARPRTIAALLRRWIDPVPPPRAP